jgi:peptidoglycan/LPS O-acetylase OafA/YrhL
MAGVFRLEGYSVRLQSLRSIAALCVAVGHSFTVMSNGRIEDAHFTLRPGNALLAAGELLFQPNTAVILFYVLSGFVLGESLRRHTAASERSHLGAFGVRRLWRLLPVMWLSILFAAAVAVLLRGVAFAGTTSWFDQLALALPASAQNEQRGAASIHALKNATPIVTEIVVSVTARSSNR